MAAMTQTLPRLGQWRDPTTNMFLVHDRDRHVTLRFKTASAANAEFERRLAPLKPIGRRGTTTNALSRR